MEEKTLEQQIAELKAQLEALVAWARQRDHEVNCWGREDPRQCSCGLSHLLKDIPEK